jgi:tRNA pseudouridine38-40 synthase
MARYKLVLEYDGAPFCGWQRQSEQASVQASLEAAVLAFCGEQVQVVAAGRTDAGVHARGQVAHLDLSRAVAVETLRNALNYHLKPQPVVVLEASAAGDQFHARFDARMRHYRYRIVNRRAPLALDRGRAWLVPGRLDAEMMHEDGQRLVGRHDFTSFRSALCQSKSPVKTLSLLSVVRSGSDIELSRDF